MNRFDERKQRIINIIAGTDDYITGRALSVKLNLSIRTIQAEISGINHTIYLINSCNRGYSIVRENFKKLQKQYDNIKTNEHNILRKLIFLNKSIHIDELADSLYMSTSTLEKSLKSLSHLLLGFELKIIRKRMYIHIDGKELNKRRLISYLIFKETTPIFNSISNLKYYFGDLNKEKIETIILNSINKYGYYVENTYSVNLIINISIDLYRMKSYHYVTDTTDVEISSESIEFKIAQEICKQYSVHLKIAPTEADIAHMAILLSGQIKPLTMSAEKVIAPEVITQEFIGEIDTILFEVFNYYRLNIDYSNHLYNFALHIDGLIKRARSTQQASNEILYNIKRNCPFIHDVSVQIAKKIGDKYGIKVLDSEIGYISVHIGFLIEYSSECNDKIQVLLFCHDYYHIDDNLSQKLSDDFSNLIEISVASANDERAILDSRADLIISTKPLNVIGKKFLLISPFYTIMDHIQIDNAIHDCLIEKQQRNNTHLYSTIFHQKLFFKRDDLKNKIEVIQFLGQKIIDFGLAEEGFIESVLKREKLSSTCFLDTFAIPHAIELNAKKTMVCVLISEKGIQWDDHNIHIVLMIAVQQSDRKEFMKLYDGIVQALDNPQRVSKLISVDTHFEFIKYLK